MVRKIIGAERQQVYEKCNGHCAYCGCELEYKDMQVDYMDPLCKGGADEISNMLPACRSCDQYKSSFDVEGFRRHLAGIHNRLMRDSISFQVAIRYGIVKHMGDSVTFYSERCGRSQSVKAETCDVIPILNYTTQVSAFKTAGEIEEILMNHKAKAIVKKYENGFMTGLSFLIGTGARQVPVRLPVKVDECLEVLKKEKQENPMREIKDTREQAERVAWRILKDWVEAQMALLDIEMVRFEEIFLPYIETQNGQTIYERLGEKQFLLEG